MNSRRNFLATALGVAGLAAGSGFAHAKDNDLSSAQLPSLKGRKVLFTYGGWDGHEPQKYFDYITTWLKEEGAEVTTSPTLDPYADKSLMDSIDLVIQIYTMSSITKEQEKGLIEAVEKNGTGLTGWHGGLCDAFRNNVDYQYMTGGQWVAHPGNYVDYEVNIIDHQDEVTKGLKDFAMKSEQYYMHVDPNVKVLATTRFNGKINSWIDGCVMPVTWKKMHGKGRVFYTSIGHNLDHIKEKPDAIEMLKRGIKWASASKYEPAEKWLSPIYAKHNKK
ncbi:ThuA domain-containing protein [Chryseosolibacter indicus]|uniref:ThuA domain-containing protein n=1 Tax=Chryseosolibacter indicus TaxID=2782351 RepID=A0ABS5VME4_9BACT|nr:ThuA domain-containing protein [Chryseosolibacter indicus]MBT1702546.1 ThuA domain-containing protein [Chryseosolibacter indicus]